MKIKILFIGLISLLVVSCNNNSSKGPVKLSSASGEKFADFNDSLSYVLGLQLGMNSKTDTLKINFDLYQKGYKDGYDSLAKAFPDSVIGMIFNKLQSKLQLRQMKAQADQQKQLQEKAQALSQVNSTFLETNKKKPGVKVTKSGLQYEVIHQGTGATPSPNDLLHVKFTASFANGEVFDSTAKVRPIDFPARGLFKGWEEAVQYMKVGGKYRFVFPPELAFGDKGTGPIPPNAVIIFDIELLGSKPMPAPPGGMQVQPQPQPMPQPRK
jgi:FKBP-type peptidyl-prolyl cis-trans isomerase